MRGREGGERKVGTTKDKRMNKEGRKLLKLLEEAGLVIWSGNVEGDQEGEFTYAGERGCSVIDVIGEEEEMRKIRRMEIGDRIESDHYPLIVELRGKGERKGRRGRVRERGEK